MTHDRPLCYHAGIRIEYDASCHGRRHAGPRDKWKPVRTRRSRPLLYTRESAFHGVIRPLGNWEGGEADAERNRSQRVSQNTDDARACAPRPCQAAGRTGARKNGRRGISSAAVFLCVSYADPTRRPAMRRMRSTAVGGIKNPGREGPEALINLAFLDITQRA